jgi:hypothetical protein
MNISRNRNQVTVCKGNTCLTVVGELGKVLAVVAIISIAVKTAIEITKVLK